MNGNTTHVVVPRDAATVLLLKETPEVKRLFMVKRTSRAAFMANAMVFPGGSLDDGDRAPCLTEHLSLSGEDAGERMGMTDGLMALALMVAAVRETFEEAGILLASQNGKAIPQSTTDRWRSELESSSLSFNELVVREQLVLSVDRLLYLSRWITPEIEKRRFDARFFGVEVAQDTKGVHDRSETTDSAWLSPHEALVAYGEKRIELAPPTLRILETLHAGSSLFERGRQTVVPRAINPQPLWEGDVLHLLLPGDPLYRPPGDHENRISLMDGHWVSTGTGV